MIERHQDAGGAEAALQRVMAPERLLQHRQAARRRREAFDGADVRAVRLHRERQAGARRHAVDLDRAGAADAVLAADMGAGAPSSWRRKSVSSMRGSASPSTRRPLSVKRTRWRCSALRRGIGAPPRWSLRPMLADEVAAVARGRVQIVARLELPGESVERVVERAAVEQSEVARRRPVGDAADGEAHALRRRQPRRRRRWRNRRGAAPNSRKA